MKAQMICDDTVMLYDSIPIKIKKGDVIEINDYNKKSDTCTVKLWGFGMCKVKKKNLSVM